MVLLHFNIFLSVVYLAASQLDPIVDTPFGPVRGQSITLDDDTVIDSYLGIPYSIPMVGDLRFQRSLEVEPWSDILDATEPRDSCVQLLKNRTFDSNEDCLHLNVYSAQTDEPDTLLPVMVYIHGGGYQTGLNNIYPGYFLARKGVVLVTINYRLGILGFAYTGDGVVEGNMGLMDQVLALQFVQESIASFGGDPNQVTIFGQSAGASSVAQLTMIKEATGLFQSAILESGCEFASFSTNLPELEPETFLTQVANQFDCPVIPSQAMVECLRGVDAQELIDAPIVLPPGYDTVYGYALPVIDGTIIEDTYENLRRRGDYIKVPEMIGITANESSNNLYWLPDDDKADDAVNGGGLNRSDYNEILRIRVYNKTQAWPSTTDPDDVYAAFNFFYTDWPYYEDPESNRRMFIQMLTDETFGYPADLHAKYQAIVDIPTYYYIYEYISENYEIPEWWGAFHGVEVDMVFGTPQLYMPENEMAFEHSGLERRDRSFTDMDLSYSEFIMDLWTNFAKFGNPTPDGTVGPNGTALTWPMFTTTELNYMHFKPEPAVKQDYRQHAYALWQQYRPYLIYDEEFPDGIPSGLTQLRRM